MATAIQYIDEVKLRLARHNVISNLSDPLILTYINEARAEVLRQTVSLLPERYSRITQLLLAVADLDPNLTMPNNYANKPANVYTINLPTDFIDIYNVILMWVDLSTAVTYRSECRKMSKLEMYNIQKHAFNTPTIWRPVYTIDKPMNQVPLGDSYVIYISGLDLGTTIPTTIFDIAVVNSVKLELWYISALQDIEGNDVDIPIPPDYEELVIYYAMMYCLQNIKELEALGSVVYSIQLLEKRLKENYDISKQKQVVLLPSKEGE